MTCVKTVHRKPLRKLAFRWGASVDDRALAKCWDPQSWVSSNGCLHISKGRIARIGDWVVLHGTSPNSAIKTYPDIEFRALYEEVQNDR